METVSIMLIDVCWSMITLIVQHHTCSYASGSSVVNIKQVNILWCFSVLLFSVSVLLASSLYKNTDYGRWKTYEFNGLLEKILSSA